MFRDVEKMIAVPSDLAAGKDIYSLLEEGAIHHQGVIFAGFPTHGEIDPLLEVDKVSKEGGIQFSSDPFLTEQFSVGCNYHRLETESHEALENLRLITAPKGQEGPNVRLPADSLDPLSVFLQVDITKYPTLHPSVPEFMDGASELALVRLHCRSPL